MRKKQMILAVLMAAVLTGCGNQAESGVTAEAKEAVAVKIDDESGVKADETAETGDESGTEADAAETGDESGVAADASDENDTAASEDIIVSEDAAAAGTFLDNVTDNGFGDADTMNFETSGRNVPVYCVDTDEKKVALSFDAAWGNDDTAEILSILKKHDIHVTFFMTGGWVESYPEDVRAILADGHDLGNHSENHKNMSDLSDEEKTEELMSVHRKVKALTGYDMFLFRPPYGDYDNDVINVAKECQYYAIQWDVDSLDWKNEGLDSIIDTVTNHENLGNGSIILCHNGAEYTAQALETLITGLEDMGYEIVPVSQLIYRENFHMNFEGRQIENDG